MYKKIAIIMFLVLFVIRKLAKYVSNKLTFVPQRVTSRDITVLQRQYKNNIKIGKFVSNDGIELWYMLYNKYKTPEWTDNISFMCHGNGGWMGNMLYSDITDHLANYSTIFTFDYRGYGMSENITPTEKGVYQDARSAWDFVTSKHSNVKTIFPVGYSLGGSIVSHLLKDLVKEDKVTPDNLLLLATFYNARTISGDLVGSLGSLNTNSFDTNRYLADITDHINIIVFHSKSDEMINKYHREKLAKNHGCELFIIEGSHNGCKLSDHSKKRLSNIFIGDNA